MGRIAPLGDPTTGVNGADAAKTQRCFTVEMAGLGRFRPVFLRGKAYLDRDLA